MKSTAEKRIFKNYSIGLIGFIVTFLQTIITVPILLKYWGNDLYGVWIALFAVFTLLQTFDFGHQSYIGNLLNVEFHRGKGNFSKYLGSSISIAFILGIIQLLFTILLIITGYLNDILGISVSIVSYVNISVSLLSLMFMWVIAGSVGGILVKILIPSGYMAQGLTWGIVFKLAQFLSLIFVAIFGGYIIEASVVYSIVQLILSYLVFRYIRIRLPEFFPWWKIRDWKTGFANLRKSTVLTLNNLLQQLSNNGLILFIASVFSAAAVPVFTTLRTITNTSVLSTNIFMQAVNPDMIRFHSIGEPEKLRSVFHSQWFFSGLIVNVSLSAVLPILETIYNIWTRGQLEFNLPLFMALAVSVSMINFGAGFYQYLVSINHLSSQTVINFTRIIVLFGSALLLIKTYGLAGLGAAIVVSELICSMLLPYYFINRLAKSMGYEPNKKLLVLAAIPPLTLLSFLIYIYLSGYFTIYPWILLIFIIITVYITNWLWLDKDVKQRAFTLFNRKDQ